jgi:hypothetical protein
VGVSAPQCRNDPDAVSGARCAYNTRCCLRHRGQERWLRHTAPKQSPSKAMDISTRCPFLSTGGAQCSSGLAPRRSCLPSSGARRSPSSSCEIAAPIASHHRRSTAKSLGRDGYAAPYSTRLAHLNPHPGRCPESNPLQSERVTQRRVILTQDFPCLLQPNPNRLGRASPPAHSWLRANGRRQAEPDSC